MARASGERRIKLARTQGETFAAVGKEQEDAAVNVWTDHSTFTLRRGTGMPCHHLPVDS